MINISIGALGKIALGIAFAGSGSLYLTRWVVQSKLANSVSYKEAMQCFRSNANATDFLGEPIQVKRIDVGDDNCYGHEGNVSWVSVPLVGKRHKGYLHYWVTVTDRKTNQFRVSRVELEVKGLNDRIILKDDPVEMKNNETAVA